MNIDFIIFMFGFAIRYENINILARVSNDKWVDLVKPHLINFNYIGVLVAKTCFNNNKHVEHYCIRFDTCF